jgi:hypothetical protein
MTKEGFLFFALCVLMHDIGKACMLTKTGGERLLGFVQGL